MCQDMLSMGRPADGRPAGAGHPHFIVAHRPDQLSRRFPHPGPSRSAKVWDLGGTWGTPTLPYIQLYMEYGAISYGVWCMQYGPRI